MKIATKLALGLLVALGLKATVGTSHAQTLDCGQAACVAFSALPAEVEITTPVTVGIAYRFQAGSYSYVDPSSGATIGARIDLTLPPAFGVGQPTPAVPWTGTCFNVPDNGTVLPVWHRRCQWTRPAFTVAPGQTDVGSVSVEVRGQPYQAPVDGLIGFGASIAIADSGASDTDVGQLTLRGQGHIGFRAFDIHAGGYGFVIDDLGAVVKGRVFQMTFIVGDMLNPSNRPFTTSPSYASLSALVRSESDIYKYGGNQVDQLQGTLTLPEYAILKDISYRDSIWGSPYAEGNGWTTTRPLPGQLGGSITFDWKGGAPLGTPMSLRADGTYDAGQFGPWGVWQSEGHHVEVTFIMPCDSLLGMDLEDPLLDHGGVTFSGREKRIAVGGAVTYNNVSTTYDSTAVYGGPPFLKPSLVGRPDLTRVLDECGYGDALPLTNKYDERLQWLGGVAPNHHSSSWEIRYLPPGGYLSLGPTSIVDVIPPYSQLSSPVAYSPSDYVWNSTHPSFTTWYCKLPREYVAPPPGTVCQPFEYSANCERGMPRSHRYVTPDPADFDLSTPFDGSDYAEGTFWSVGWDQALGMGCVAEAQVWMPAPGGGNLLWDPRPENYDLGNDPGTHLRLHDVTHVFATTGSQNWENPASTPAAPLFPDKVHMRFRTTSDIGTVQADMIGATAQPYAAVENRARIGGGAFDPDGPQGLVDLEDYVTWPGNADFPDEISYIVPVDGRPDLYAFAQITPSLFTTDDVDGTLRVGFHNFGRGELLNPSLEVLLPPGFEPAPIDPSALRFGGWLWEGGTWDSDKLPDSSGSDVTIPGLGLVANHLMLVKGQCTASPSFATEWGAIGDAWAISATASSFWAPTPPIGATGKPDVAYCDHTNPGWLPTYPGTITTPIPNDEWLELEFADAKLASGVEVAETLNFGSIASIDLIEPDGTVHAGVWPAPGESDGASCNHYLEARWPLTSYLVKRVRLNFAAGGIWPGIDAVRLLGGADDQQIGPGQDIDVQITQELDGRWRYAFTLPPDAEMRQCGAYSSGAFVIGMHPKAGYPFVANQAYRADADIYADNFDLGMDGTFGDPRTTYSDTYISMNPAIDVRTEPDCALSQIQPAFRVRYRNVSGVHQYGAQAWFVMPASLGNLPVTFAGLEEGPTDFPAGATNHHFEVTLTGDGDPGSPDEAWELYVPATHIGQAVVAIRVIYGSGATPDNRLTAWSEGSYVVRLDAGPLDLDDVGQCGTTAASIQTTTLPASSSLESLPFCIGMCGYPLDVTAFHDLGGVSGVQDGNEPTLVGWQIAPVLSGGAPNVPQGQQAAVTVGPNGLATILVYPGQTVQLVNVPPVSPNIDTGAPGFPGALDWTTTTPGVFSASFDVGFSAPAAVSVGEVCSCSTTNLCRAGGTCVLGEGGSPDEVADYTCSFPDAPTCDPQPVDDCLSNACDPTTGACATSGTPNCHIDLALGATSSVTSISVGGDVTWTLSLLNSSTVAADNVQVNVALPAGFQSAQSSDWTIVSLAPGETATYQIVATATCAAVGSASLTAAVVLVDGAVPPAIAASAPSVAVAAASSDDTTCDGVDDDCDLAIDDDADVPTTCGSAACARTGVIACVGTVYQADTCIEGQPLTEICDGVDNDCDGSVDEATGGMSLGALANAALWLNVMTCGDYTGGVSVDGAAAIGGLLELSNGFSVGFRAPLGDEQTHQPNPELGETLNIVFSDSISFGAESQGELYGHVYSTQAPAEVPVQVTITEGGERRQGDPLGLAAQCDDMKLRSGFICSAAGALAVAKTDAPIPSIGWWGSYHVETYQDGTNFFEIDADSITGSTTIIIDNHAGWDAIVVVNVVGTAATITLDNGEVKLLDIAPEQVLFNFCGIADLEIAPVDLSGYHFYGSILAPETDVIFNNGEIFGWLGVKSLAGRGTLRLAPFAETLEVGVETCP